jgi:ATP-dependent DNA helicase RecG
MQEAVGITHREHFRKAYLLPALKLSVIEMTRPDKPNSRSQQYRLTELGRQMKAASPQGHSDSTEQEPAQ